MAGTIIGAGIFSLPFVFEKSGIIPGMFFLVFLTMLSALIHLMYADIIVRTDHNHKRFPGYAEIYFGKKAGFFANLITLTALTLTLTVYIILSASFINLIAPTLPQLVKILIFWILGSMIIFLGIRKAAIFESTTTIITLLMIFAIFVIGFSINPAKITSFSLMSAPFIFLPFGAILFSLLGESGVPPVIVYAKDENLPAKQIKKIIVLGTVIPAIFYTLFILGIFGFSGQISEDAVSGLIRYASPAILFGIGIFGFVSLWDSYSAIGTDIKKTLEYEWKLPGRIISALIVFLPVILYFLGFQNFLELVSLIGGILYSIWAIMIILVWRKCSKNLPSPKNTVLESVNPLTIYLLLFIFLAAIIYHIINFI